MFLKKNLFNFSLSKILNDKSYDVIKNIYECARVNLVMADAFFIETLKQHTFVRVYKRNWDVIIFDVGSYTNRNVRERERNFAI